MLFFCRLLTFSKIYFFKKRNDSGILSVSNILDPAQQYVGLDLDANCLQRLSADNKSRVNTESKLKSQG